MGIEIVLAIKAQYIYMGFSNGGIILEIFIN